MTTNIQPTFIAKSPHLQTKNSLPFGEILGADIVRISFYILVLKHLNPVEALNYQ